MNKKIFTPADILLPKKGTDMTRWSVIACDQYTSEAEYWKKLESFVGSAPSTLSLILPEVYLESEDVSERTAAINTKMKEYMDKDIFTEYKDSLVYVERIQSDGIRRLGIVGKIDLEEYDYSRGSTSPVRATEATVLERIPPRVKIREDAPLELPHIMILIDDPENTVIEPLEERKADFEVLYDNDLNSGGGHITGRLLDDKAKEAVLSALDRLSDPEVFNKKYGLTDTPALSYAMGDGNHSLATAKACYENLKKENPGLDLSNHPARYALVEIVNLHSPALNFEAIHRSVTEIDTKKFIAAAISELGLTEGSSEGQNFILVTKGGVKKAYHITKETSKLTVGSVQNFIDKYIAENGGKTDYIHGEENLVSLIDSDSKAGFILPCMDKSELFPTVIADGALPRKTFSMGHADDKRFYTEARKIK